MDANTSLQADTAEQQNQGAAPAPTKVPRNGKLPKIKRSENSFRPGLFAAKATPVTPTKPKELIFSLPASSAFGNGDEAASVQLLQSNSAPILMLVLSRLSVFAIRRGKSI